MPAENVIWLKFSFGEGEQIEELEKKDLQWGEWEKHKKSTATQKSHETSIEWEENCYFSFFFIAMLVTVRSELEIQEETVEEISSDRKKSRKKT